MTWMLALRLFVILALFVVLCALIYSHVQLRRVGAALEKSKVELDKVAVALARMALARPRTRDSDGSPKGGDGEAGSMRSTTARAAEGGIAETPHD